MKNLELLRCVPVTELGSFSSPPSCLTVDCDTGIIYTASTVEIIGLQPESQEVVVTSSLATNDYFPDNNSNVIGIQHLPDLESVCVCMGSGDVLLYNTLTQQTECVGSTDSGISCMAWSPDLELVVFTTGENTVIMMTKDFDPITEFPIHTAEFGQDEPINVGWGKKETQFHGSAGKPSTETLKPTVTPSFPWDDHHCRISWRGDGQYFVVSAIEPATDARKLRVWSREGVLMTSSEEVDGLEQSLCWKPSGSLIASTQRKPHRHDVVFFERNGLRHGEFTLPFQRMEVKVIEMQWSTDSTVLAIRIEEMLPEDRQNAIPRSYIQLWTVNNYHWYLKQELAFPASASDRVACFSWDPENALKLHLITGGGQYASYEWTWSTLHSQSHSTHNISTVAVIDGANLLLTPMKYMVVPPPMAAQTVAMPAAIQSVTFAPPPACNDMAVLLSSGDIAILRMPSAPAEFIPPGSPPRLQGVYSIIDPDLPGLWRGPGALHHVTWWRDDKLVGVVWNAMSQSEALCEITIKDKGEGGTELVVSHVTELDEPAMRVTSNPDTGSLAIQLVSGVILKYNSDKDGARVSQWLNEIGQQVSLPQTCVQMRIAQIGNKEIILGLTSHYRLYADDKEVATNCTSFAVHDEFLLLSTHAHTCRCISLLPSSQGLPVLLEDKPNALDESIRRVERGSQIVVAVTQDTKVILQVSAEFNHSLPLILNPDVNYRVLSGTIYRELYYMESARVRILFTSSAKNERLFLANIETFLKQVESVAFINLFLSDLRDEDTTITMYGDFYPCATKRGSSSDKTKIDTVCDACREALQNLGKEKYLLSILMSYAKKTEPELETVLSIIRDLKNKQVDTSLGVTSEEALKYVLFLVDVNQMFDVALGMYDFQLVLMVAEKSQKDPKEYLPFLNNLRQMETNYQRYMIDKHLKRFTKAIKNLSLCGSEHFHELVTLVKEKSLYKEALKLYSKTTKEYQDISICYGKHLFEKKKYEEAGIVFSRVGAHSQALEAFQRCCSWRHAFCVSSQLEETEEKKMERARGMAAYLKEHHRFTEAATVLEDYAKDPEEAIVSLLDGSEWDEALRMIYKHNRVDIIETNLKPALVEGCRSERSITAQHSENFTKYKERLHIVRETKERLRIELLENGTLRDDTDADIFSDTSSITGQSGFGSSVGSKGTRSTGEHVTSLLRALALFGFDSEADALQKEFHVLVTLIEGSLSDIWLPQEISSTEQTIVQASGPGATVNSIIAAMNQSPSANQTQEKDSNVIKVVMYILEEKFVSHCR
ncbi:predicted protein [Nematostella vectensis]|uniref:Elongator complex protein 1 n=1 Tax=Nematostella vectensis TaxID=45351 RepID=A7SGD5_NEMVE|nr:predicted protein [Nematostella vectensis]|eukprot:XP_001629314.1 predicted protein [Nematostella vectensis]